MKNLYMMRRDEPEFVMSERIPSVELLDLRSSAPQITPTYTSISGSDGQLLQTVAYNSSTVTVSLYIRGNNRTEFELARDAVQREFYSRKPLRIRTSDNPGKAMWVVMNPTDILPLDLSDNGKVDLTMTMISGLKTTPFRSDEMQGNQQLLGFGMGLSQSMIDNPPSYTYNTSSFQVYNPSDVPIDPYTQHHDMIIRVTGNGSSFMINNRTNGTSFTVSTPMNSWDVMIMNGVTLYLNGVAGSVLTDFGHLKLERGNNDITMTGLSDMSATFSFPFIYY